MNQGDLAKALGKSKATISQYISGRQNPPDEIMKQIRSILGIKEEQEKPGGFQKISVEEVAKIMGINHNTVRKGLQQRVFPWGYAIKTSEHQWSYVINAKKFFEMEGIKKTAE